jgi:hypothetical protein
MEQLFKCSASVCVQTERAVKYVINKTPDEISCQSSSEYEVDVSSINEAKNEQSDGIPHLNSYVILERLPLSVSCKSVTRFNENDQQHVNTPQECQLLTKSLGKTASASGRCGTSCVIVKRMADDSLSTDSLHQKKRKVGKRLLSQKNEKHSSSKMYHTRSQTVASGSETAAGSRLVCCVACDERNKNVKRHSSVTRHSRFKSLKLVNDCAGATASGMLTAADGELTSGIICSSRTSSSPASSQLDSVSLSSCDHSNQVSLPVKETLTEAGILFDVANEVPSKKESHYKNVRRNIFDSPAGSQTSFGNLYHEDCELPDLSGDENDCMALNSAVLFNSHAIASSHSVPTSVRCTSDVSMRQQPKQDCSNQLSPVCPRLVPVDTFVLNEVC